MMRASKWLATCLGIGYIQKGAGTVAALFCCGVWWFSGIAASPYWAQLSLIAVLFFLGVITSGLVEGVWGHDSSRVVIDEVLGMAVSLFLLPHSLLYITIAFVLFRLFDIAKPFGIRRLEALPSGWGVMADDAAAGLYTVVILQLLHYLKFIPVA